MASTAELLVGLVRRAPSPVLGWSRGPKEGGGSTNFSVESRRLRPTGFQIRFSVDGLVRRAPSPVLGWSRGPKEGGGSTNFSVESRRLRARRGRHTPGGKRWGGRCRRAVRRRRQRWYAGVGTRRGTSRGGTGGLLRARRGRHTPGGKRWGGRCRRAVRRRRQRWYAGVCLRPERSSGFEESTRNGHATAELGCGNAASDEVPSQSGHVGNRGGVLQGCLRPERSSGFEESTRNGHATAELGCGNAASDEVAWRLVTATFGCRDPIWPTGHFAYLIRDLQGPTMPRSGRSVFFRQQIWLGLLPGDWSPQLSVAGIRSGRLDTSPI